MKSDVQTCVYRRAKVGGVRCKISLQASLEKRGSFGVGSKKKKKKKKKFLDDVDSPKWGSSNMQKCNFKPKCANSMLKFFCQNWSISENAREARKNLQFVCKIWYKSGNGKRGVMVWAEEKRGSLGVRSEYKKGSRPYWQALNVNWHMGVPPPAPTLGVKKKKIRKRRTQAWEWGGSSRRPTHMWIERGFRLESLNVSNWGNTSGILVS